MSLHVWVYMFCCEGSGLGAGITANWWVYLLSSAAPPAGQEAAFAGTGVRATATHPEGGDPHSYGAPPGPDPRYHFVARGHTGTAYTHPLTECTIVTQDVVEPTLAGSRAGRDETRSTPRTPSPSRGAEREVMMPVPRRNSRRSMRKRSPGWRKVKRRRSAKTAATISFFLPTPPSRRNCASRTC